MPPMTLLRIFQQHKLIRPGESLIVAVSGGTDSLALLHMLHEIQAQLGVSLIVATFDHRLRPDSSEDVRFVCEMAASWSIPVVTGFRDSQTLTGGIETAAREARYAFLAEVARNSGASRIAVAHHAGDQAETILMHILRGAGTQGLRGMTFASPVPGAPDLTLIRPLLTTSRAELEAYCREHALSPCQDSTNDDTRYTRNYIRHTVLPFLKTVNPQVESALIRLAEITAVDQDYLTQQYDREVRPHIQQNAAHGAIDRAFFATLHPAMRRRWISQTSISLGCTDAGYQHILHAESLGLRGSVGAVAQLPGSLRLRVDYEMLVIEPEDARYPVRSDDLMIPAGDELPVNLPGETRIPGADWVLRVEMPGESSDFAARLHIPQGSAIVLRTRRPGDRFAPGGMNGQTQSLKKWMINRKIPRALRDTIPLLVVDHTVAAVCVGTLWAVSAHFMLKGGQSGCAFFVVPVGCP